MNIEGGTTPAAIKERLELNGEGPLSQQVLVDGYDNLNAQ